MLKYGAIKENFRCKYLWLYAFKLTLCYAQYVASRTTTTTTCREEAAQVNSSSIEFNSVAKATDSSTRTPEGMSECLSSPMTPPGSEEVSLSPQDHADTQNNGGKSKDSDPEAPEEIVKQVSSSVCQTVSYQPSVISPIY